jgi:hypothetical protein
MKKKVIKNKFKIPKPKKRSQLIKDLDTLTANYIKKLQKYECQRCHTIYKPKSRALTCSHFYKRGYMGTRWDWNNLDAMCWGCHKLIEGDKQEDSWYSNFMKKKLGEEGLEMLKFKAHAITKYSYQDIDLMVDLAKSNLKGKYE